ncbi:SARP family transcriptional regulator [Isoptericola jiangsuensis]|uniref:SARP family transcriptional regulator n=1 Tax=Isoptericola jiangsuensis TaxID=548579 RepID=A0A2A9ERU0_9MICO|nr:AAA family ATPase [Isoptericola jiangsuensis]PFG41724.1 SARP family transcriptional regulator [Isoptericola jiangsuensis]
MPGDTTGTTVPLLSLGLLGGFTVERADDAPVVTRWRRPSARTVLKLLALADGHRLHRDVVAATCWPDADDGAARRNLRVALHAARHAVEPELPARSTSSYVVQDGELLALHPTRVRIDVEEAFRAAEDGLRGDPERLAVAHALLSAELLPEDRHAEWTAPHRTRLADLRDRVAHATAAAHLDGGRPDDAIAPLLAVLDQAPADEAAHLGLMRAYLALGHRRQALAQYHRCVQALRDDFGTTPGPDLVALYSDAVTRPAADPEAEPPAPVAPPAAPVVPPPAAPPPVGAAAAAAAPVLTPAQRRTLDTVLTPGPRVTLLSGEPGVGKSRLAAAAAGAVRAAGGTVLWGSTDDAVVRSPYGPFADALNSYVAGLDAAARATVATEYPELVALLPALGPGGSTAVRRSELFAAVGTLLDGVPGRPVLVVLEDLHAADVGTLRILYHLARTQGGGWRVLATLRDDEPGTDEDSRRLLDALVRHGHARRVELMRLSRAECDELVRTALGTASPGSGSGGAPEDGPVDGEVLDQVWALSLGNPMFALEVTRALTEDAAAGRATVGPEPGTGEHVPVGVRDLVGARIDRFDATVQAVLAVLAARPGTTSLPELTDVVRDGVDPAPRPAALAAALDRATEARVVEPRPTVVGGRQVLGYAVAHPMTRLVCAQRTGEATRRAIHAAHLAAVRRHRPDLLDLHAWHALGAEDPSAEQTLVEAARRASRVGAHDAATAHLERALGLPVERPSSARATLLLDLAVEQRLLARYADAAATLQEALDALGDDDPTTRVRAIAMLAELHARGGRTTEAAELLARSDLTAVDDPVAVAEHHLSATVLAFLTGRYADGLASTRSAADRARAAGGTGTVALIRALSNEATCLVMLGHLEAAREVSLAALAVVEPTGDAERLTRVLSSLAEISRATGHLTEAVVYAERALAAAEQVADPTGIAFERGNLSQLLLLRGRTADAERLAVGAVDLVRPFGATWCLAFVLLDLAQVRFAQGDVAAARTHLQEVDALAGGGGPQVTAAAAGLAAELELRAGRPVPAWAAVGTLDDAATQDEVAPVQVRVLSALGRHAEAAARGRAVRAAAVDRGDRSAELRVTLALAEALSAADPTDPEARRLVAAARQLASAMPCPPLLAQAERLDAELVGAVTHGSATAG